MMIISTVVRNSLIHGVGVFATEAIKSGQVIWEYDPIIDINLKFDFVNNHPSEELRRLIYYYGYIDIEDKYHWVYNADNGRFMNHARSGNANTAGETNCYAIRDVEIGEELTCDYHSFYTPNPWQPWLAQLP